MSTLYDVCIELGEQQYASMMFGYTAERRTKLDASFKLVRAAIIKEFGADLEKLEIKASTKLRPKSQKPFEKFVKVTEESGGCAFPVQLYNPPKIPSK